MRRTLGVVCAIRVSDSNILSCHVIGDLHVCFYLDIHSCMQLLTVKKVAKFKFLHYYNTIIWGGGYKCSNGEIFGQEIESKLLHHLL